MSDDARPAWIDAATDEICGDPSCCDLSSCSAERMSEIIERHYREARTDTDPSTDIGA